MNRLEALYHHRKASEIYLAEIQHEIRSLERQLAKVKQEEAEMLRTIGEVTKLIENIEGESAIE